MHGTLAPLNSVSRTWVWISISHIYPPFKNGKVKVYKDTFFWEVAEYSGVGDFVCVREHFLFKDGDTGRHCLRFFPTSSGGTAPHRTKNFDINKVFIAPE